VARPVVLFDVMSTLVHDPFGDEMPGFFGMTTDELIRVKHPDAWVEFERGAIDEATFLHRFFADGRSYDHRAFVAHVTAAYRYLPGIPELLAELWAHRVPMHALSNYPVWYRRIEGRLRLSRFLDWTFVSCETGYRKPDPAAYLHAVDTLRIPPERCLFVDDREKNCAAARGVGMDAIRFAGAPRLRQELTARGLLDQGMPGSSASSPRPTPSESGEDPGR